MTQARGYQVALRRIELCRKAQDSELNLRGLELTKLPEEISELANVTTIFLGLNQIAEDGLHHLAGLKGLTRLYLGGNRIGDKGARHLASLTRLIVLDLDFNPLGDLSFLQSLERLRELHLSGTDIKSGDPSLLMRPDLERLLKFGGRFLGAPKEILSRSHGDNCLPRLRDYYAAKGVGAPADTKARVAVRPDLVLSDTKVMILGNGQVGKTQLRRRLEGKPYDAGIPTTHGLEIASAKLAGTEAEATALRVWDFGGQDIYLGTHALFLKTRAVFVLAWTPERESPNQDPLLGLTHKNYPLAEFATYVHALAGPALPLIAVQTQCESAAKLRPTPLPPEHEARFSLPVQKLHYAARTDENVQGLYAALRTAVRQLRETEGQQTIPATWGDVKTAIEVLAAAPDGPGKRRVMSRTDFRNLCSTYDVTSASAQDTLLDLLHHFGTLFFDAEVNPNLVVVDQTWALQAIYAVFDRDRGGAYHIVRNRMLGRFTRTDLAYLVWGERYSKTEQNVFLDMMRACGVAFVLRDATDEEEELYLAPELLPPRGTIKRELALRWGNGGADATWSQRYHFLAPASLREIMREIGSQAQLDGLYWDVGLHFFDGATNAQAVIEIERPEERSWRGAILIESKGSGASDLLDRLMVIIRRVEERFGAQIEAEASVTANASDYDRFARRKAEAHSASVTPRALPMERERCFISYAHGGDGDQAGLMRQAFFDATKSHLETIGLLPFFDTQDLPHGESIDRFMSLGASQPKIVIILSAKYLNSPYCMDELRRIWRHCGSQRDGFYARVRTVCLQDAKILHPLEQEAIRDYWKQEAQVFRQLIDKRLAEGARAEATHVQAYNAAIEVKDLVVEILSQVADTIHVRTLSEIRDLRFPST